MVVALLGATVAAAAPEDYLVARQLSQQEASQLQWALAEWVSLAVMTLVKEERAVVTRYFQIL